MPVIRKWGNSLALRIPLHIASQLNVRENSAVEYSVTEGVLHVKPVEPGPKYSLCALLAGITESNLHREVETGEPRGEEVW